ncbi:MAG: 4-hydroxybenzoate octaprenyltransferase [Parvularculaceae bacterium]
METTQTFPAPADAAARNWVDRYAPAAAKPYLRLMRADRPIGAWLLWLPCGWGAALALAGGASDAATFVGHALLFAVGAVAMRGAGCVYNDIVDRDIDAKVARTANRPLPSGQLSVRAAWIFLIALCLVGLFVLLQFNGFTIALGFGSLALVAAYPFMKRITWWPQAWLGLTFNWGALVGYAAAGGGLGPAPIAVYAAGVFWTLGYDTIYAHMDKDDDALIGVKSSARALGERTRPALAAFYAATIALLAIGGLAAGLAPPFYVALAAPAAHLAWQVRAFDADDAAGDLRLFKSNRDAGLLALAAFLLAAAWDGAYG